MSACRDGLGIVSFLCRWVCHPQSPTLRSIPHNRARKEAALPWDMVDNSTSPYELISGWFSPTQSALEQLYQTFCAKTREAGGLPIGQGFPKPLRASQTKRKVRWRGHLK